MKQCEKCGIYFNANYNTSICSACETMEPLVLQTQLESLLSDRWTVYSWSERPSEGNPYFVVKVACELGTRGIFKATSTSFKKAVSELMEQTKGVRNV
jgi:hypothetical protein